MKFRYHIIGLIIIIVLITLAACTRDKELGYQPTPYSLKVPAGFPQPYVNENNPLTVEGIELGRRLYYDPILSTNGLTCSRCHAQNKAFSSPFHTHPDGDRTSVPSHSNLAWKREFLWEGGTGSIEDVCIGDFEPEFFNTDMNKLVRDLKAHADYPRMIYKAFGIANIEQLTHLELKKTIVAAISQFVQTIISHNSRFDKYQRGEALLTQDEFRGYIIFNTEAGDCFHCHGSILMTDNKLHNTGLDEVPIGRDRGHYTVSGDINDLGKFITPTLRNVSMSAPYMHDGRFQTLEEVVEFYNSGVHQNALNIDPLMTKPNRQFGLQLSAYDKKCLVDFLKTFTDSSFMQNAEYSSPF